MEPEEKGLSLSDHMSKLIDLPEYTEIKKLFEPIEKEFVGKPVTPTVLREMSEKIREIGGGAEHLGDVFKKYGHSSDDFTVEMDPTTGGVTVTPKHIEVEKSGGSIESSVIDYDSVVSRYSEGGKVMGCT